MIKHNTASENAECVTKTKRNCIFLLYQFITQTFDIVSDSNYSHLSQFDQYRLKNYEAIEFGKMCRYCLRDELFI